MNGDPEGSPDLLAGSHAVRQANVLQAAVNRALQTSLRQGPHDRRRAGAGNHDPERLFQGFPEILCASCGSQRMAAGIEEAQVMGMDNVPRTEGNRGMVRLAGILDAGSRGKSPGSAVVRLQAVLDEEVSRLGGGVEPAVGLDELLGLFGDEAPDGVSQNGFFVCELAGGCGGGGEADG